MVWTENFFVSTNSAVKPQRNASAIRAAVRMTRSLEGAAERQTRTCSRVRYLSAPAFLCIQSRPVRAAEGQAPEARSIWAVNIQTADPSGSAGSGVPAGLPVHSPRIPRARPDRTPCPESAPRPERPKFRKRCPEYSQCAVHPASYRYQSLPAAVLQYPGGVFCGGSRPRFHERELVDQEKPWAALQTGIHVKLINGLPASENAFERQASQSHPPRSASAAIGRRRAGRRQHPLQPARRGWRLQHPVGLSRAGEITGKNRKDPFRLRSPRPTCAEVSILPPPFKRLYYSTFLRFLFTNSLNKFRSQGSRWILFQQYPLPPHACVDR